MCLIFAVVFQVLVFVLLYYFFPPFIGLLYFLVLWYFFFLFSILVFFLFYSSSVDAFLVRFLLGGLKLLFSLIFFFGYIHGFPFF